jgi:hypothetical protein
MDQPTCVKGHGTLKTNLNTEYQGAYYFVNINTIQSNCKFNQKISRTCFSNCQQQIYHFCKVAIGTSICHSSMFQGPLPETSVPNNKPTKLFAFPKLSSLTLDRMFTFLYQLSIFAMYFSASSLTLEYVHVWLGTQGSQSPTIISIIFQLISTVRLSNFLLYLHYGLHSPYA